MSMRNRMFPFIWRIVWPLRWYVTHTPLSFGLGTLQSMLCWFLPAAPAAFTARVHGEQFVELQFRELIGLHVLLHGGFEQAEAARLCELAEKGSTAFDVGANIGVITVPLAAAVGPKGRVVAFEPSAPNVERLRRNAELNGAENVEVMAVAVGRRSGSLALHLSADPAFHSTVATPSHPQGSATAKVPVVSLDETWIRSGRPAVSVLKVDVEGAELDVLKGAAALLETCRPAVLVEAPVEDRRIAIETFLGRFDYRRSQPSDFMPWNHLFLATPTKTLNQSGPDPALRA
jgi:FkbM family methyltransferase